jgi:F0F1-type ATP synthase assembly protein I
VSELSDTDEIKIRSGKARGGKGMVLGAGIGIALGAAFGHVALGLIFGALIGLILANRSTLRSRGADV